MNSSETKLCEVSRKGQIRPIGWSLDSAFTRATAQAAVELDWILQKRHGKKLGRLSKKAIREVLRLVGDDFEEPLKMKNCWDFIVVTNGLLDTGQLMRSDSFKDVGRAARRILKLMSGVCHGEKIGEKILEKLRDFCVSLSKHSSLFRKQIYCLRL